MLRAAKCRWAVLIAAGIVCCGPLAAQQPSPEERLAALARQLDADEFLARETATLELLKAGPAALPALESVLKSGSLEATSRAFYVLREQSLAANLNQHDAAWNLLVELAARKEIPVLARRAEATLTDLRKLRSTQALSELEALGAKIERGQLFNGIAIDDPITSLEIGADFRGQEQDLWRLKWLAEVPQLIFVGEKVTDGWVKHAAAVSDLAELHLYQTNVGDAGLAALAGHESLEQLGIYYTPVTDAGLKVFDKLPALNFVKLYGTKVTAQRAADLRAASGIAIDDRRGAFLGVGCSTFDGTCTISTVHTGSPADKAGLLSDDIIVRFAGSPVTTFDTLTALIGERAPGDEVEVEVTRRSFDREGIPSSRPVVTKVKFAPWEQKPAIDQPRRR